MKPETPCSARVSAVDLSQSTGWAIWKISSPVMLSSVLFTLQTTVNMFWVGRLGPLPIAAVALAGSVVGVVQSLAGMVSAGTLATCARFAGAGDRSGIHESLLHSVLLAFGLGLAAAALTAPFSARLLQIFGAEPAVAALGQPFLELLLLLMPFFFLSTVVAAVFQAMGDTRTPMWIALGVNAVNLALDPFLILGWLHAPRLGVLGAGIAAGFSQLCGLAVLLVLLRRRGFVRFGMPIRPALFKTLLGIGTPASLQAVTRPLTGMLLFRIVASFGSMAIAAFGIGLRILNIMYIYLGGLGTACQSLVGQNLGARKPEVAARVAVRVQVIALGLQLIVLSLLFGLAPQVIRIFNGTPEIARFGTAYLRILAPFLLLLGLSTAWSGTQYGAGDTRPTMLAAVVANWLVKLPLAYILSRVPSLGLNGVWLGIGFSIVIETLILGISYFRGGWRRKELVWQS